ncbi:MAG: DUF433 domain-containing protein [Terriglobales bacterium]
MPLSDRIVIDPERRSSKPCIRDTRISVADVLEYMASGMTPEDIVARFPQLELEDVQACLQFAADRERRLMSYRSPPC